MNRTLRWLSIFVFFCTVGVVVFLQLFASDPIREEDSAQHSGHASVNSPTFVPTYGDAPSAGMESAPDNTRQKDNKPVTSNPLRDNKSDRIDDFTFNVSVRDDNDRFINNASVYVLNESNEIIYSASSTPEGTVHFSSFELDHGRTQENSNRTYYVRAEANGFFSGDPLLIDKQAAQDSEVIIRLKKKFTINGRVISSDGDSLSNIEIICRKRQEIKEASAAISTVFSAADGLFSFYPLPSGSYVVAASDPVWLSDEEIVEAEKEQSVTLTLKQMGILNVRVLSVRDEPVQAAKVNLNSCTNSSSIHLEERYTDTKGFVLFSDLRRGQYQLWIHHDWYNAVEPNAVEICQASQSLTVRLPDKAYTISGHVVDDESREGIASVPVVCAQNTTSNSQQIVSSTHSVNTDEEGFFQFENLSGGVYQLYADRVEGYISGSPMAYQKFGVSHPVTIPLGVEENVTNIVIYLKKMWGVSGHIYDEQTREPIEGVKVSLRYNMASPGMGTYRSSGSKEAPYRTLSDAEGYYFLKGFHELRDDISSAYVFAGDQGYLTNASKKLKPIPGKILSDIDFYLEKGVIVEGHVSNQKSEPLSNAKVIFIKGDENRRFHHVKHTDETGYYHIVLNKEPVTIRAMAENYLRSDYQSDPVTVDFNKVIDDRITYDFTLQEGELTLHGIVTDLDNNPIQDISIHVLLDHKQYGSMLVKDIARSGENGEFQINLSTVDLYPEAQRVSVIAVENDEYESDSQDIIDPNNLVHLKMKASVSYGGMEGLVRSNTGNPITNYSMIVIPSSGWKSYGTSETHPLFFWNSVVNEEGKFFVNHLPITGNPYSIAIRVGNQPVFVSNLIDLEAGTIVKDILIQLEDTTRLFGRIINTDGVGVENVRLKFKGTSELYQMSDSIDESQYPTLLFMPSRLSEIRGPIEGITDTNGNFILNSIPKEGGILGIYTTTQSPFTLLVQPNEDGNGIDLGSITIEGGS